MSNSEAGFVRLPPDSTGKKSAAAAILIIDYQGETSPNLFEPGQTVVGATSSASAQVVGKNTEGFAAGEGQLYLNLTTKNNNNFTVGEDLQVSAVTYATVKPTSDLAEIYYQKQVVVDRDYPDRYLTVGENGAANIQFPDGPPSLSTFGGLVTDNINNVRTYVHAYDGLNNQFYDQTSGSGTITYVSNERAVTLDTGFTSSGDLARRTSHFYHPYQPGVMSKIVQTVVVGDAGKANVRRRWGYFDENNGAFWELDGTTLYAVLRSSTSGSPVDTRVQQSNWNQDKLDGTTRFELDVTKANIYFIDLQWLGVGLVRFGVFEEDGSRTLAHVFENPNSNTTVYMRQATLPIRFECENTSTAASSSELKTICSAVQSVGNIKRQTFTHSALTNSSKQLTQASGEIPILSTRVKQTYNGLPNHVVAITDDVNFVNVGDAPVLARLRVGSVLSGASYTGEATSHVEYDVSATGFAFTGVQRWSKVVGPNSSIDATLINEDSLYQDDIGSILYADDTTQIVVSLTAEVIDPTKTGEILASTTWKEVVT